MATFQGTRFSSHFKGFSARFPMRVWHVCVRVFALRFQKSRYWFSRKRSILHPKSPWEYEVSEQWREFDRLLAKGHPLTIEMLEEMEVLEAFALLEWLKKRRGEVKRVVHCV